MAEHILSLSYGKDSLACLGAIEQLGWPIDRIIHAEVWATDTIPADLPPMVEFKAKADAIIRERWGIEVEHVCAMRPDGTKKTYESIFYRVPKYKRKPTNEDRAIKGFPYTKGAWCNDRRKSKILEESVSKGGGTHLRIPDSGRPVVQLGPQKSGPPAITGFSTRWSQYCTGELKRDRIKAFSDSPEPQGAEKNTVVQYLGIAADEPVRLERLKGTNKVSPLAELGWVEADCRTWCEENDLLSPIYTTSARGGCWFCHNQGVDQLRLLRKNYPDLWALLLKWDEDSPVTFHADGHTVHDFDRRFQLEDEGLISPDDKNFRWEWLDVELNLRWF